MLEAVLHRLLERTTDAALVADMDGTTSYWNRAAEKLFGYPASQAVGQPCAQLIDGRDELGNQLCRPDCTVLRSCSAGREIPSFDLQARTSAGRRLWVNISILQFQDSHRRAHFCIHLMRDIGQRKKAEEFGERLVHAAQDLVALAARHTHGEPNSPLSDQERRILRNLAKGRSPAETAARLKIAPRTLRNHLYNVNRKLGTRNRLEALVHAMQRGLI